LFFFGRGRHRWTQVVKEMQISLMARMRKAADGVDVGWNADFAESADESG